MEFFIFSQRPCKKNLIYTMNIKRSAHVNYKIHMKFIQGELITSLKFLNIKNPLHINFY